MDGYEFYGMVERDPELQLVACVQGPRPEDDYVEVRFLPYGGGCRIAISAILASKPEDLIAVMRFERPATIMKPHNAVGCSREHPAAIRMISKIARAA